MAARHATTVWERRAGDFRGGRYSRRHRGCFDGGIEVTASSSPQAVPLPLSDPAAADPEESFVAALSSCHRFVFGGPRPPTAAELEALHHRAHAQGVRARSVRSGVRVVPQRM